MSGTDIRELVAAAVVNAGARDRLELATPDTQMAAWRTAVAESMDTLLAARICAAPASSWTSVRGAARAALVGAAALETVQRRELARVTAALRAAGIDALLLKGAAWAYTVYPSPELRPRLDTDLLVAQRTFAATHDVLVGLGYAPAVESVMRTASAQRHYAFADANGTAHAIDLHWRVTDRLVFGAALPFERLWARSIEVPGLPGARTLCAVDALELASLHRVAHHGEHSRLLWLFDVHLLAASLTDAGWDELATDGEANGLRGCCARALDTSARLFGTIVPARVQPWVSRGLTDPLPPAFAGAGVPAIAAFASDWQAASWRERASLVREHVFPGAAYMRARYRTRGALGLCGAYVRRFVRGAPRWLAR